MAEPGDLDFDADCTETNWFRRLLYCPRSTDTAPATADALFAALVFSFASLGGQLLLFLILRSILKRIYSPRVHLVPERERLPQPPGGLIGWLKPLWTTSNSTLIQKCGLDAYFFLRFLRLMLKIFVPSSVLLLPILLPINSTSEGGRTGLNRLALSNVADIHANRLWAHLILAVLFISWVCYLVFHELVGYVRIRQGYLTSPQHRLRASATTVLVEGIPEKWLSLEALSGLFDVYPGGIRTIWINRNYDDLAEKVNIRGKHARSLEAAETALIKLCLKKYTKKEKKEGREPQIAEPQAGHVDEGGISTGEHQEVHHGTQDILQQVDLDGAEDGRLSKGPSRDSRPEMQMEIEEPHSPSHNRLSKPWLVFKHDDALFPPSPQPHAAETDDEFPLHTSSDKQKYPDAIAKEWDEDQDGDAVWCRYITADDRETMRLPIFNYTWFPAIPFIGEKVDKIYWLRRQIARLNLEIETDQSDVKKYPHMNSAFIQFNNQIAAHMCCQSLSHHLPQQMTPRQVEISPEDVIWDNMSIKWWERYLRTGFALVACAVLIVVYAIPVAFTGLLGNIEELSRQIPWLGWLQRAPAWIRSLIQGLLPTLLLLLILMLVPIIFRFLIQQKGVATGTLKERGVQTWYYAFLFIQVFFVVTISTGFAQFIQHFANNPAGFFSTLADSIPPAANYFFSYLTVQALSNSASNLLQGGSLLSWFILAPLLDTTPREKWTRQTSLNQVRWGSFFPPFTNFATIGIIYSILSPLITVFMLLIFGLFSLVYRYNVLYVYQFRHDTGGLLFPVAINQLFTGIYFLEICLTGIFFSIHIDGTLQCIPQAAIMIVVLAGTVLYQWQLNKVFKPLFEFLPITLEDEAVMRDEEFAKAEGNKPSRTEAQQTVGDVLYGGFADELEDLTPEERDTAVRYAFQHDALRAKRPVIWIPRDALGVSDDEIKRAKKMSTVAINNQEKTHIWMSNEGTTLDGKGRVKFASSPPDFSSIDIISL